MTDLDSVPPARLRCSIQNIARMVENTRQYRGTVLWGVVAQAFGYGSTSAHEICRKAGLDPSAKLPLK